MGLIGKLFGGGSADVSVSLGRTGARPGDAVVATVRVTGGKKHVEIEEGRVELVCANEYTYRERESSLDDDRRDVRTRTTTDEDVVQQERFLEPGTIGAGSTSSHTVELRVPADAAPSADGKITRVEWEVRAILNRRRAGDPEAKERLRVVSPRESYAAWGERAQEVDSHGDLELSLRLESRDVGPGGSVEGALLLKALRDCEVIELRVELERFEEVPRGQGNEERITEAHTTLEGKLELAQGFTREFPVRLSLPGGLVPCLRTKNSTIRWLVRGVGARRMRSDYNVVQELNVFSEGADVPATSARM